MPCLSHVLIVLGGVFQIAGVAWAVMEVEKIRRSLIALRKVGQEIAAEIRAMLGAADEPTEEAASKTFEPFSLDFGGKVSIEAPPQLETLEERVAYLETRLTNLSKRTWQDKKNLEKQVKRATERADAIDRELRELIDAQEEQRRESQASARRLQGRIAPLVVIGLALSVLGSVVPC